MREKSSSSECPTHLEYVRGTTEMCSRDPPALHPALAKANGQNSSPQPQGESRIDGGRLKFFKDGKFILELSHRRDGERNTWIPVPKKTFWPPASTTPNRQESSTSLSVSDDNSSIQSSPWQRDHCWKQARPRRCTTTEYNFYYYRNRHTHINAPTRLVNRKRRRPLDPTPVQLVLETGNYHTHNHNRHYHQPLHNHNQQHHHHHHHHTPPPHHHHQQQQYHHHHHHHHLLHPHNLQQQQQQNKVLNKSSNNFTNGKVLTLIIDKLSRLDPNVVSPRKRILRELERVTLEDQASKRRATPPQPSNVITPVTTIISSVNSNAIVSSTTTTTTVVTTAAIVSTTITAATTTTNASAPSPKQLSSYSITSILGEDKPNPEPGFLRNLLDDGHAFKYSTNITYPRTRVDPFIGSPNPSIHHPLYGVPLLQPGPYRTPGIWMHYPPPIHYPPPTIPAIYPAPPPHPSSSPVHHYKDYREQTLSPPSDKPLNLSKHAG